MILQNITVPKEHGDCTVNRIQHMKIFHHILPS
jgi:hypothetical protein